MSGRGADGDGGARAFRLGDDVDTDQLAPGKWMKGGIEALAAHCLEEAYPGFADAVRPGDLVVAGRNFGAGSSREQAAQALVHLGVRAVVAESFAGIFHRNAINLGLPALVAASTAGVPDGARVGLDLDAHRLTVRADGGAREIALEPVPENLLALLADGGLVPHLKKRLAAERQVAERQAAERQAARRARDDAPETRR